MLRYLINSFIAGVGAAVGSKAAVAVGDNPFAVEDRDYSLLEEDT